MSIALRQQVLNHVVVKILSVASLISCKTFPGLVHYLLANSVDFCRLGGSYIISERLANTTCMYILGNFIKCSSVLQQIYVLHEP